MNRLFLPVAAAVLLSACAAPTQTRLDDGTLVYRIECEGSAAGLNYCFGKAGKSCGAAGFTVVDETGKELTDSEASNVGVDGSVSLWAGDQNSILVKCGV
ncbi:MAG: hypothetical protein AAGD86_03750 [Pseudomonadota bacterium]